MKPDTLVNGYTIDFKYCAPCTPLEIILMKFNTICNAVKTNFDCVLNKSHSDPDISEIQLLTPNSVDADRSDIMYTNLQNTPVSDDLMLLACNQQLANTTTPCIIAPQETLLDIQNFIGSLLFTENKAGRAISDLSLKAMKRTPLQAIVNDAASVLQNPIIVIDNSYKVITYATDYDIADPLWERIIEDGYAPYSLLLEMNRIVSHSNPDDALSPFYVSCDLSPVHKLAIRLTWENYNIGYIVMFNVPTPINVSHWSLLPQIAEIVTETLSQAPNFGEMYGNSRQRILECLLEKNLPERINILLSEAKITVPTSCTALVLKPTKINATSGMRYFEELLKDFLPTAFVATRNKVIYMVLPRELTPALRADLQSKLAEVDMIATYSPCYSDFFDSLNHLRYCQKALKIETKLGQTTTLADSAQFRFEIILNELKDPTILTLTESPVVNTLRRYDQAHDTELLHTLATYLANNRYLKDTAAALFIHRNTLTNRLERITDLTELDLGDSEALFRVEYSLRIMRFLKN